MKHLLSLIQGGGLGDGIKRARLKLVQEGGAQVNYSRFDTANVSIRRSNFIGHDALELRVSLTVDAKDLKRQLFIDGLVLDLNNCLGAWYGFNAHCPTIAGLERTNRAKRGQKALTFCYEISQDDAKRLGFRGGWSECLTLKRGA